MFLSSFYSKSKNCRETKTTIFCLHHGQNQFCPFCWPKNIKQNWLSNICRQLFFEVKWKHLQIYFKILILRSLWVFENLYFALHAHCACILNRRFFGNDFLKIYIWSTAMPQFQKSPKVTPSSYPSQVPVLLEPDPIKRMAATMHFLETEHPFRSICKKGIVWVDFCMEMSRGY